MNINAVRLVSIGVTTGFVVMCKDSRLSRFLNAHINSTFLCPDSLLLI